MAIRAILLDLSGVLLDFRGHEHLLALSDGRVTKEVFDRFWLESRWAMAFSQGACSRNEFAMAAIEYFDLGLSPGEFLKDFRSWYNGPYPGALRLVETIREKYKVGCLSNTNEIDVPRFRNELRLQDRMDVCIFSNEVGMTKPSLKIYRLAAKLFYAAPPEIVYIDDSQICVDAAISYGMKGCKAERPEGVRRVLRQLGLF